MSSSTDVEMIPPEGGGVEGAESSTTGQADTTTGEADTDTSQAEADTDTGEDVPMEVDSDVNKAELGLGLGLASGGDKDDRESDANWDAAGKSTVAVPPPPPPPPPPSASASDYQRQPPRKKPSPPPSFWTNRTSYSQRDTQNYRDGYQGQRKEEGHGTQNVEFYQNERRCQPDDMLIDEIHKEWWGDYRLLEYRHGYIQWLFPIREQGLNYQAQKLNQREIEIIRGDEKALSRILTSYKMMLDFYGMELISDTKGDVMRGRNWERGFDNLNHSMHNYLRITRILKCLGEFDYEHLKAPFIRFVLREAIVERTLSRTLDSCKNYWIQVLRSDEERKDMTEYIKKLNQEQKEKRENQKRISDEKIEREKQLKKEKKREREKELNDKKKEENDKKKKEKEENDKKKKEKELNDKKKNEKELNDKKKENEKELNGEENDGKT